jgi:hypothetical protein
VSFRKEILPIFEARCIECHGPDKDKADLRLDSVKDIFNGDPEWWVVEPGDSEKSLLVERIILAKGHPDAMPPRGDPLSSDDVQAIRDWINQGADYEVVINPAASVVPSENESEKTAEVSAEDAARLQSVDALRTRGVIAMRIAQDTNDWEVNASLVKPPFNDDDLKMLSGMRSRLIWLNLARSAVTDSGMTEVAKITRLESLRLDNTSITDAGLESLMALDNLMVLNLYGTEITDAGLEKILSLPKLVRVYCAGSQVTPKGLAAARASYPSVEIVGPSAPPGPVGNTEESKASSDT